MINHKFQRKASTVISYKRSNEEKISFQIAFKNYLMQREISSIKNFNENYHLIKNNAKKISMKSRI